MRKSVVAAVLTTSFVLFATSCAEKRHYESVTPQKADDFVNSIGVNTHFGYAWSNYNLYEDRLKPRLLELGVKHIREDVRNNWTPEVIAKFKEVGQHGIKILMITRADLVKDQINALGDMVWGVEGLNEPDYFRKKDAEWIEYSRGEQKKLYELMKSDPSTRDIPVLGISMGNPRDNSVLLGDISEWIDYGSIHPYAAGEHPMNHWGWGMSMDEALSRARIINGDKPIMATECGYHNDTLQTGHPGISEEAAAIYHMHLPFVYFNNGIVRSYKYEFLDLNPDPEMKDMECHFGLVRTDGTPKPSFYAFKNLLSILSEKDVQDFTPEPLAFQIDATEPVYSTLLQKGDGSWWLAMFRNVTVYDLKAKQDIKIDPIPVTVKLEHKAKEAELFIPNVSDSAQTSFKNTRDINFDLGAELVIVKIQ